MTTPRPKVILLAGPAGAGKTTTAARIAENPEWVHLSEDDHWTRLKAETGAGGLRTSDEQVIVQQQVVERLLAVIADGKNAVLELILYEDPPVPLIRYQDALVAANIPFATRILRPTVDEILRRIQVRGRASDRDPRALRANAENQVNVLASRHIDEAWIIDSTHLALDEVYEQHLAPLID